MAAVHVLAIKTSYSFVYRAEEWIRAFRFHVDRGGRLSRWLGAAQAASIVFLPVHSVLKVNLKMYLISQTRAHSEPTPQ